MLSKVVFITGISSGFGKEIAQVLASNGYSVYGTIRGKTSIAPRVNSIFMDLCDDHSIVEAVAEVTKREGRIDVLINNAAMHIGGPIEEASIDVIQKAVNTNYIGWIRLIQETLPIMRSQNSGTIINISSIGGMMGLPFQGIYSSLKYAIEGLSEALRLEVKAFNIDVIVLNPGDFKTKCSVSRVKSLKEDSAYLKQYKITEAIIEKDEAEGGDPIILAQKVLAIINSKQPKYRYLIGSFIQKSSVIIKRILPARVYSSIFSSYYRIGK